MGETERIRRNKTKNKKDRRRKKELEREIVRLCEKKQNEQRENTTARRNKKIVIRERDRERGVDQQIKKDSIEEKRKREREKGERVGDRDTKKKICFGSSGFFRKKKITTSIGKVIQSFCPKLVWSAGVI